MDTENIQNFPEKGPSKGTSTLDTREEIAPNLGGGGEAVSGSPSEPHDFLIRARSARRLRHEAQAKVFEKESGSLEQIRQAMGLRPSQICEILKVHPSAWTRWTRTNRAPPHVFQMLEWYMELLRWRGQHSPLPPTALKPRAQEDLEAYVPAHENFTVKTADLSAAYKAGVEDGRAAAKMKLEAFQAANAEEAKHALAMSGRPKFKVRAIAPPLTFLWITQILVLGFLAFVFVKIHGFLR